MAKKSKNQKNQIKTVDSNLPEPEENNLEL
jgi:hypothetical protein